MYQLCLPPSTSGTLLSAKCAESDKYWHDVERANVSITSDVPVLAAALPAADFNFLQLSQQSAKVFSVSGFEVTTTPKDLNQEDDHADCRTVVYPVFDLTTIVEFSFDDEGKIEGFGLQNAWGAAPLVEKPTGKTAKERAEVWFDRVG